ncbi:MAG: hypothetical protein AAGK37_05745 [Pseudomonadota bacterium]
MNTQKIYDGLKAVAALSGLVAFISFAYTYYKDVQLRQSIVDRSWQETEIYRVVVGAGVHGISFDDIVSSVQSAFFSSGLASDVGTGAAQENAVRRGLIGLTEKAAIVRDTEGNYLVPAVARNYLTQDLQFSRRQELDERVFQLVLENPGRYSGNELRQKLEDEGATPREAWQVVGFFVFSTPPAFIPADFGAPYSPDVKLKVLE